MVKLLICIQRIAIRFRVAPYFFSFLGTNSVKPDVNPRLLQSQIKQDFRTSAQVWQDYRSTIIANFSSINYQDLSDHLLREFNRKIATLGLSESLFFQPFDGGYRFLGVTMGDVPDEGYVFLYDHLDRQVYDHLGRPVQVLEAPDSGYVFVYDNLDRQVYDNLNQAVQVLEEFANS